MLDMGANGFWDKAKQRYDGKATEDYLQELWATCATYHVALGEQLDREQ